MTINAFVLSALNAQANHEFTNQQKYLSLASWAEFVGLTGCAKWLKSQAQGEAEHAGKVIGYIEDRNERYTPSAIVFPAMPDDSVQSVFQSVYETEIGTTATLEAMYRIANESGDYLTCQWLVDSKGLIVEQVEEENKAQTILDRIAICGVEGAALAAFDSWIGSL